MAWFDNRKPYLTCSSTNCSDNSHFRERKMPVICRRSVTGDLQFQRILTKLAPAISAIVERERERIYFQAHVGAGIRNTKQPSGCAFRNALALFRRKLDAGLLRSTRKNKWRLEKYSGAELWYWAISHMHKVFGRLSASCAGVFRRWCRGLFLCRHRQNGAWGSWGWGSRWGRGGGDSRGERGSR